MNRLIRGSLYAVSLLLVLFLTASIFEYYGYYEETIRKIIFFVLLTGVSLIVFFYLVIPGLKIFRLGRTIDDKSVARIIGKYFPEVKDKLLNIIQLREISEISGNQIELIKASIEQKTGELRPVPFQRAVDFTVNRKYLRFALPVILVFILILLISPRMITESSNRILHYNVHFDKPAPFEVLILNEDLSAVQNDDFQIEIAIDGEELPENLYIRINSNEFKLKKRSRLEFYHQLTNLQSDIDFRVFHGDFSTPTYRITVFPKPVIMSFETRMDYPDYIGKTSELFENTGDLVIPEGTEITWNYFTKDVDTIMFRLDDDSKKLYSEHSNVFTYTYLVKENTDYAIKPINRYVSTEDTMFFQLSVIKDSWPAIFIEEYQDSGFSNMSFFNGMVKDDYGFRDLDFVYYLDDNKEQLNRQSILKLIDKKKNQDQFYYSIDFNKFDLQPEQELNYYFEVWDNDEVNGSKNTRSKIFNYRLASREELREELQKKVEKVEEGLEEKIVELNMINQEIDELEKQLLQKEKLTWQDKKRIEDVIKRQEDVKAEIEDLIEENKKNLEDPVSEDLSNNLELLEKQRQLQELFESVLDEETKKLMEQLKEMLEKLDKDKVMQMMDKIKMSNEDLEKQLDRNLELLKQLEYEKLFNETTEKLTELARKQEELSNLTEEKKTGKEELSERQNELKEEFEDVKTNIDELNAKNQELEEKNQNIDLDSEEQAIDQEMNNSLEELQKNRMKNASKSQKSSAKKMESMSQAMLQLMQQNQEQQLGEDIEALRTLLENLLESSFDQEELILKLQNVKKNDPNYTGLLQNQHDIKENFTLIEDSLLALSKRQFMIEPFVFKELNNIKDNIPRAIENIEERRIAVATEKQQYIMTAMNNLTLLLAEALQNMQNSMNMQSSKSGKGSCTKPGSSGSSSAKSLKEMQQQLNTQLEQMQKGQMNKGQEGQSGKMSMSEQFARMAAEQAAIRSKLQKYMEQLKEQGMQAGGLSEAMQEMEKTEEELVNRIINNSTINRQKNILSRLLKSEKAEMEREKKKERESKEAKNVKRSNPENYLEYKRIKIKEAELLKTVNPQFNIFYKRKVNSYFYNSGLLRQEEHERIKN